VLDKVVHESANNSTELGLQIIGASFFVRISEKIKYKYKYETFNRNDKI